MSIILLKIVLYIFSIICFVLVRNKYKSNTELFVSEKSDMDKTVREFIKDIREVAIVWVVAMMGAAAVCFMIMLKN